MAIHQQKRENFLLEATAYRERLLLRPEGLHFRQHKVVELFAGCRANQGWSFYFDESPVVQFNSVGQLRRLYVQDDKMTVSAGRLLRLTRTQRGGQVHHEAIPLTDAQQSSLLNQLAVLLNQVQQRINVPNVLEYLVGSHPEQPVPILEECRKALERILPVIRVAQRPNEPS